MTPLWPVKTISIQTAHCLSNVPLAGAHAIVDIKTIGTLRDNILSVCKYVKSFTSLFAFKVAVFCSIVPEVGHIVLLITLPVAKPLRESLSILVMCLFRSLLGPCYSALSKHTKDLCLGHALIIN